MMRKGAVSLKGSPPKKQRPGSCVEPGFGVLFKCEKNKTQVEYTAYGTREIERACRENVYFMYLLEGHRLPDYITIR